MDTELQLCFVGEVGEIHALTAADNSPIFSGCSGQTRAHILRIRESILELFVVGCGVKRIAFALNVSPQSVRAVRAWAWQNGKLDPLKQRLGRDYLAVADMLRAEALERIDEIPAHVLLLASAQAADKGQLLTGGATARIERAAPPTDLDSLIDALPCTPVEVRDVGGEKGGSERLALASPSALQCSAADVQSDVSASEAGGCSGVSSGPEGKS